MVDIYIYRFTTEDRILEMRCATSCRDLLLPVMLDELDVMTMIELLLMRSGIAMLFMQLLIRGEVFQCRDSIPSGDKV